MSTLIFLLFNCAIAFVAYWSKQNDPLAEGTTIGLLAMRNPTVRQALTAAPTTKAKATRVALHKPSMSFRSKGRK
jgi:hypothetical protein